jgi:acyl CoA:acetate/3-ketoacid CoA transferase alpha subunit
MDVLESGGSDVYIQDVDDIREWMRDNKSRALVDKVMTEQEAVSKFVHDGDYLSYDLSSMVRGPMSLEREIIRQGIKDLWLAAKFTLLETTILVAAGCCNKIDVGFIGLGRTLSDAVVNREIETIEWSNGTLTLRHKAGAMGVPFLPTRALLGTDTLKKSAAKVVTDPFTEKRICLVPAVNPDVAVIHVNQCDKYGNARIFGPSVSPLETAQASKRVILSTEEIIDTEEIRKHPGMTTIPYFLVNAVVNAPFGCHPGTTPGLYQCDQENLAEFFGCANKEEMNAYLQKYVYGVKNHEEYLEIIGKEKLDRLSKDEIREGYYD